MAAPRFTMVVLMIEDLARSVAFYGRLGIAFPDDVGRRTDVQVPLGDGHQLVLTTTFAANLPERQSPAGDSRIALEFFVDSDAEVEAMWVELVSAGAQGRRSPYRTTFGAYMCLVEDPDGNTVLVTAG